MAAPPVVDLPVADERLAEDISEGLAAVEKQTPLGGGERGRVRHGRVQAPHRGRRQAFPRDAGSSRRPVRRPDGARGHPGRRRHGTDPRGHALPRRRDGRGDRAARQAVGQRPVEQHGGHPDRRLRVRPGRRHHGRPRVRSRSASRPRPSPAWSAARSARPSARPRAPTRSSTTSTSWPTRRGR